jgi:hypothetical protein
MVLVLLAGCAAPRAIPPPPSPPLRPPALACLDALGRRGAVFESTAEHASAAGCRLDNGVTLAGGSAQMRPVATLTCPLALALLDFEEGIVQPAAVKHFGQRVSAIRQVGAYSCRARAGSGRLSTHAFGQAIDIAGFDIEAGLRVDVREHWRDPGPRGRFLREVARLACERFNVVLTPNSDANHADHFHLDIGSDRLCGA